MRPLLLALFIALLSAVSVDAQSPAPQPGAPAGAAPTVTPGPPPAAGAQAAPAAAEPQPEGFAYKSDGRRDPFVSLLRRGADLQRGEGGRPAGVAGLSVSEVVLKGTVASRGSFVAILQGVDSKTYIVRQGDKLFDGSVRGISQDAMVLVQHVNDPLSLEKQREVRKALRQTEEAK